MCLTSEEAVALCKTGRFIEFHSFIDIFNGLKVFYHCKNDIPLFF